MKLLLDQVTPLRSRGCCLGPKVIMGKLEIVLVLVGLIGGGVWYWLRSRGKRSDDTMTEQGGGGRGGLKR